MDDNARPMSVDEYVARVVADAPPLTQVQREAIIAGFAPLIERTRKQARERAKSPRERLIEQLVQEVDE